MIKDLDIEKTRCPELVVYGEKDVRDFFSKGSTYCYGAGSSTDPKVATNQAISILKLGENDISGLIVQIDCGNKVGIVQIQEIYEVVYYAVKADIQIITLVNINDKLGSYDLQVELLGSKK